jgi:alpha-tubulin suppressor-like RCC1 family protein
MRVSTYDLHTCAISTSTELFCWGINTQGQLGAGTTESQASMVTLGTGWTDVATGSMSTCGIRDSDVFCWGTGKWFGQTGTHDEIDLVPTRVHVKD